MNASDCQKKIFAALQDEYRARNGADALEAILDWHLPFHGADWLFRALEAGAKRKGRSKKASPPPSGPAAAADELAKVCRPYVKKPSVELGAGFGLQAGMLGIQTAVESRSSKLEIGKRVWEGVEFVEADPFDWIPPKKLSFALCNRLLDSLGQGARNLGGFKAVLDRLGAALVPSGGHLAIVDSQRYQDDIVELLARGDYEILELQGLADGFSVVALASCADE